MPNTFEHEQHRWSYMSPQQLLRRLGKIKDPTKLRNFAACASNYENDELLVAAARRAADQGLTLGAPFDRQAYRLMTGNEPIETPAQNERDTLNLYPTPDATSTDQVKTRRKRKGHRVRFLKGLE